jgi:hypothetical protein
MKNFLQTCGVMCWIGSVFALEAVVIDYSDLLGNGHSNWLIAGPAAFLMFIDIAAILTVLIR